MSLRTILSVLVAGLLLGAFAYGLTLLLDRAVLNPIFCQNNDTMQVCLNTERIAANMATVLAAVAGMFALLQLGVYRPLLIAGAAAVILWGSTAWLQTSWLEEILWSIGLYGLIYTSLVWLSRVRNFVIALIAIVIVVAATRLLAVFL